MNKLTQAGCTKSEAKQIMKNVRKAGFKITNITDVDGELYCCLQNTANGVCHGEKVANILGWGVMSDNV